MSAHLSNDLVVLAARKDDVDFLSEADSFYPPILGFLSVIFRSAAKNRMKCSASNITRLALKLGFKS
jgi:hypothetical protein